MYLKCRVMVQDYCRAPSEIPAKASAHIVRSPIHVRKTPAHVFAYQCGVCGGGSKGLSRGSGWGFMRGCSVTHACHDPQQEATRVNDASVISIAEKRMGWPVLSEGPFSATGGARKHRGMPATERNTIASHIVLPEPFAFGMGGRIGCLTQWTRGRTPLRCRS